GRQIDAGSVRYQPAGNLVALVDARGTLLRNIVPDSLAQRGLSRMTLAWGVLSDGRLSDVTDASGTGQWRVMTSVYEALDGSLVTLVAGVDITDVDATITRYGLIFFLFAVAVVLLGAAVTQLLVDRKSTRLNSSHVKT